MSSISTHVLDLVSGKPAAGMKVHLEKRSGEGWEKMAEGVTDADGRIRDLIPKDQPLSGVFQIVFETGEWCRARNTPSFYPFVPIVFEIPSVGSHYHVPLLLGPFGYSTYRGS